MKKLLCSVCGVVLVATYGFTQTNADPNRSNSSLANSTSQSTTSEGKVVNYKPGADITIDEGNGSAASHFPVSPDVKIIGSNGETVPATAVKTNALVKIHFSRGEGKPMVDQITLQKTD